MRDLIRDIIVSIDPFDQLEAEQLQDVAQWIASGASLFRIQKPDIPPKHLVSYFILFDEQTRQVLLVDHIKAGLWLPPGGHVKKNEDPKKTVMREMKEEIFIQAEFIQNTPFFLTVTRTVNCDAGHTDVSLWYLLKGNSSKKLQYDAREINGYKWLTLEDATSADIVQFDPHFHRFVKKLLLRYPKYGKEY
ncbi:MAG TPA: NUDIX hydrolase [Candidatus Sulfotelmatobacter sp.]|jgi:8-oxo-dGTP diphosphatase|nr:NUDIX hydrolase [Candidatus Sulfotelmatobacter sp.]